MTNGQRRVLAIIPARGGSVGLPRKNLRRVAGIPLVAHAIGVAKASALIDRAIVSTDDNEIAAVAREYGGEVPFTRPDTLSQSNSKMFDVLLHAVETIERSESLPFDDIVLLQPTSPLRLPADVDTCLEMLWSSKADSVITVYRHPQVHPRLMYTIGPDGIATPIWVGADRMPQRQDLHPVFIRTGLAYAFRRSLLQVGGDIYGRQTVAVEIPFERSFSIDDASDLVLCEAFACSEAPPLAASVISGARGGATSRREILGPPATGACR